MIPAILSCVFVIYLYHNLKQADDPLVSSRSASAVTLDSVSDRIQQLQARLDKLANGSES